MKIRLQNIYKCSLIENIAMFSNYLLNYDNFLKKKNND